MQEYTYGENTKNTKQLILTDAGFSLDGKRAFYVDESLVYFSQTSFDHNIRIGVIKEIKN